MVEKGTRDAAGTREEQGGPDSRGVVKIVVQDVLSGELKRTLGRDLRALYEFYLDEESRARLARMGRVRRSFRAALALLKSLVRNLSPARRVLLVVALVLSTVSSVHVNVGDVRIGGDAAPIGSFLLLVVLMLELKDKLLARRELEIGRAVQLALLPDRAPAIGGWDVWLYTRPANDVGGDLVDAIAVGGDRTAILLGDMAGKGLGAALLMAKVQATLRAFASESGSLADLGQATNRILCRDGLRGSFATLCYLELRPKDGRVRLLNAGHMPPLVVGRSAVTSPPPVALPLGARAGTAFLEQTLDVEPGGLVLLYSDGLTEAFDATRQMFGMERFKALLPELRGRSAEQAGERILRELDAFVGETPASDDLSLAVLRRLGGDDEDDDEESPESPDVRDARDVRGL